MQHTNSLPILLNPSHVALISNAISMEICLHAYTVIMMPYQYNCSVSTSLPSIIDAAVAINAFRRNYSDLSNIIHDTLPSLANDLFAKSIITNKVREKVLNTSLGTIDRAATLLDATQTKIRVNPSDFIAFIEILDSEPYLKSTAKRLVQSYCK